MNARKFVKDTVSVPVPPGAWTLDKVFDAWASHEAGNRSYDHKVSTGRYAANDVDVQAHAWLSRVEGYVGIRHFLVWLFLDGGDLDRATDFRPGRYDRRWQVGDAKPFGCGDIWRPEAEWGSVCRCAFRLFVARANAVVEAAPFVPMMMVEPLDVMELAELDAEDLRRRTRRDGRV